MWFYSIDSLVNSSGYILVPGIYENVASLTDEERKLYEPITFNLSEFKDNVGVSSFLYKNKV